MQTNDGVFLYLNDILCCTADSSGSFRPSDVFRGADRVTRQAAEKLPSLKSDSEPLPTLIDGYTADHGTLEGVLESDCPIFSSFGVLSGGVVVDAWDASFVDYTSTDVFTPSLLTSSLPETERTALREKNKEAYRWGMSQSILAEASITVLAVPRPPLLPGDLHHVPREFSRKKNAVQSREIVEAREHTLALPEATSPQLSTRLKDYLFTLSDLEQYRANLCTTAVEPLQPLRSIPHVFQCGGVVYNGTDEAKSLSDPLWIPPRGVRSRASSFFCYSGLPTAMDEARHPRRTELTSGWCPVERVISQRMRSHVSRTAPTELNGALHCNFWAGEEEPLLRPYSTRHPRTILYPSFTVYLYYLGILQDGQRIDPETNPVTPGSFLRPNRSVFSFCPAAEYNAEAEVERKRRDEKQRRMAMRRRSSRKSPRVTTLSHNRVPPIIYRQLMEKCRTELLRRVLGIVRYLHQLRISAKSDARRRAR